MLLQRPVLPAAFPESDEHLQEAAVLNAQAMPAQQEHQCQLLEMTADPTQQREMTSSQLPHPIMSKQSVKRQTYQHSF